MANLAFGLKKREGEAKGQKFDQIDGKAECIHVKTREWKGTETKTLAREDVWESVDVKANVKCGKEEPKG